MIGDYGIKPDDPELASLVPVDPKTFLPSQRMMMRECAMRSRQRATPQDDIDWLSETRDIATKIKNKKEKHGSSDFGGRSRR